ETLDGPATPDGTEPLDHEGRFIGLEPVPLALAHGEPLPLRGAGHGEKEEAEGRRIHDLAPVVEDPALGVDPVPILSHAAFILLAPPGTLEPAADPRPVGPVLVAELAFQIALFRGDHADPEHAHVDHPEGTEPSAVG